MGKLHGQQTSRLGFITAAVFGICVTALLGLRAQQPVNSETLFADAHRAYEQSNFQEAAQLYEQIIRYGIHNDTVYYNLGNTYFKLNNVGRAILCYEKALRLNPADQDLSENLAFVKTFRIDQLEESETPSWLKTISLIHNLVGLNGQLRAVISLWILTNGGIALWILRRDRNWRRVAGYVITILLILLFSLLVSVGVKINERLKWEGIIVVEKVDLLSGPSNDNPVLVSIHEGMKVEIRNETEEWYQVILPNGWNGWIPRSALEPI